MNESFGAAAHQPQPATRMLVRFVIRSTFRLRIRTRQTHCSDSNPDSNPDSKNRNSPSEDQLGPSLGRSESWVCFRENCPMRDEPGQGGRFQCGMSLKC